MANGLIDLQTDLKSLRYGNDKPYVTKNIGQAPGSRIGMEVQARIDDTSRIAQMLIDKPGLKYLGNEALLQQTNIQNKLQKARDKGKTLGGAILQQLGSTAVNTVKIAASTLAQVPVNGTGTHFLKGFRTDTYLQPTNGNQASGFAQFFGAGGVEGAPLALKGRPIEGEVESNFGTKVSPTEFRVTAQSSFDYDEKVNTLIPNISSYVYAKQGTPIIQDNVGVDGWKPYTNTGVKEQFVNSNTNKILSQSKFVNPAVQNKSRIKPSGSVVSSTVTIPNPTTGGLISIPGIQTTATPGVETKQNLIKGSVTNKDVKYDLGDNGNDVSQSYTSVNTYTTKTAKDVIGNALTGAPIPVSPNINDNIHPKETTVEKGKLPGSKNSKTVKGTANQPNVGSYVDKSKYNAVKPYKKGTTPKSDIKSKPIPPTGDVEQPNSGLFETFSENKTYTDAAYNSTLKQPLPNLETYYVPNQANVNTVSGKGIQEVKEDQVGNERFTPNRDRGTLVFGTQKIQDFRNSGAQGSTLFASGDEGYANIPTEDYTQYARETRVGLGAQGKRIARVDYNAPTDPEVQDKINALDLTKTNPDGNSAARDFAKLYFEVLNPDRRESVFIHFRAFLDSLDDSFNADWQGHKYVGRAEDFYTYGGFSRDINFSFKIAAATRSEMKPLYKKMVYLASTTAPTYGDSAFMRGTVVKLTLGSYLTQVPGVLTSIKYAWQTDYPWEIAMKSPESGESDVQELPMVLDCSVTFKPIHNFAPQTGLYHYITSKNTTHPGAAPFFTEAEQVS
jgi:hypothetical protein